MTGSIEQEGSELLVRSRIDADAGVPFWLAAAGGSDSSTPIADRITLKLDGIAATIADLIALVVLELVVASRDQQQEPTAIADILHVGEALFLAVGALAVGEGDVVFGNELAIDGCGVFAGRNPACDIPPVAVAEVADRHLLDEPFRR